MTIIAGPVFRVFVPMIVYFIIMWTSAFVFVFWLHKKEIKKSGDAPNRPRSFEYDMAVVQAFTAGSNNFVSYFILPSIIHSFTY